MVTQGQIKNNMRATTSQFCIITVPNRKEAGIPALAHQYMPIEIVSLYTYVPFWSVCKGYFSLNDF